MNANDAWAITERMMQGDFNPYHDEGNGQFTFANAIGAVAPLRGKTENGERLLQGYKEKHGGKKAENATEGKQAEGGEKTSQKGEQAASGASESDIEKRLKDIESDIAVANILDDQDRVAELEKEKRKLESKLDALAPKGFNRINHDDAERLADMMGQTELGLGEDYNLVTGPAYGYFCTGNSFRINAVLRDVNKGYDALDEDRKATVDAMDRNMAPLPIGIKATRMVDSEDFFKSMKKQGIPLDERAVGKVFIDGGYSSSSFDLKANLFKGRDVALNISAPEGALAFFNPMRTRDGDLEEAEVTFARSTAYVITGFKKIPSEIFKDDYTYKIDVEILVDD